MAVLWNVVLDLSIVEIDCLCLYPSSPLTPSPGSSGASRLSGKPLSWLSLFSRSPVCFLTLCSSHWDHGDRYNHDLRPDQEFLCLFNFNAWTDMRTFRFARGLQNLMSCQVLWSKKQARTLFLNLDPSSQCKLYYYWKWLAMHIQWFNNLLTPNWISKVLTRAIAPS